MHSSTGPGFELFISLPPDSRF